MRSGLLIGLCYTIQQGGVYGPLPPLSIGVETIPVGVAYVFGSEMPDLFIVNNKLSTEPGMYLYEWLRTVRPKPARSKDSSRKFRAILSQSSALFTLESTLMNIHINRAVQMTKEAVHSPIAKP